MGSGRTDAGVHALGQVANFRTGSTIPLKAFHAGLNSMLPYDIAVLEAQEVSPEFHARKSALAKTYEYRILNRPSRSPLHHHYGWWLAHRLDLEAMAAAAAAAPRGARFFGLQGLRQRQPEPGAARFSRPAGRPTPAAGCVLPLPAMASCGAWSAAWWAPWWRWARGRPNRNCWRSCWRMASAAWPVPPPRARGLYLVEVVY